MLKYRFASDLHLETDAARVKRPTVADLWQPLPLDSDSQTTLILPGDIWNGVRPLSFAGQSWLALLASRFKAVVLVLGNHDYWDANVSTLPAKWRRLIADMGLVNIHLLEVADGAELGAVVIDGVRIIGGTLWTDMHKGSPLVASKFDFEIGRGGRPLWNDQNFIRATSAYHSFTSKHWLSRHRDTIVGLRQALAIGDEPILLVTHHAPCLLSAPPRENDPLASYLYASDLSDLILDNPRIKVALHGHTHRDYDYQVGGVRVRCNPRGYTPMDLVAGFDPLAGGEVP